MDDTKIKSKDLTVISDLIAFERPYMEHRQVRRVRSSLVFSILAILLWVSVAPAQTTVNCNSGGSLQTAINAAFSFVTINITGTCSENIFIRDDKTGITLDGGGTATISGSSALPTFEIRGRGITVRRITITGGTSGLLINHGADVLIEGNTIQNSSGNGVTINRTGFAVLVNNMIQSNADSGILVNEGSSARIGFFSSVDSVASPNTIQNNAADGIGVSRSSNARIVGNIIRNNGDDGIHMAGVSHANIASNRIEGNGGDGIEVSGNSGVNLGNDTGSTIHDLPNTTTVNNTGFGIRCFINSSANGRVGSLNGNSGPSSFTSGCINSLIN